jgi:hypothetical protein
MGREVSSHILSIGVHCDTIASFRLWDCQKKRAHFKDLLEQQHDSEVSFGGIVRE